MRYDARLSPALRLARNGDLRIEEHDMTAGRSTEATVESLITRSPVVVAEDERIAPVAELPAGFEINGLPV